MNNTHIITPATTEHKNNLKIQNHNHWAGGGGGGNWQGTIAPGRGQHYPDFTDFLPAGRHCQCAVPTAIWSARRYQFLPTAGGLNGNIKQHVHAF